MVHIPGRFSEGIELGGSYETKRFQRIRDSERAEDEGSGRKKTVGGSVRCSRDLRRGDSVFLYDIRPFDGSAVMGCWNCKYFREDTIHQSGYGSVHHYSCKFPVIRKVTYPIGIVEEKGWRGVLEKPLKECKDEEEGKPERWNQIL